MTAAAQRMAKGDYAAVITTSGRDEVGELARAFSSMATELEQSEEHRRRLVATVAHELRTPLAAQQALLENPADGVTAPDETTLRAALSQSERLASLVTDLLDLSRPDGRGVPFSPSRVRVQDLLDGAVDEATLRGSGRRPRRRRRAR
uniref:HAMP domain-containing protein n=1 Tax=Janibacter limosus TaxID=53458 RepID=A0AC61U1Z8_9MICO|nr:histidine kinase dimerization/phospho-acceptor domain-containing protein [Janibacter limosus]